VFDIETMGRDVFVRPSGSTWKTMKGKDGQDWIELSRDQALYLSAALNRSDNVSIIQDDEDG